MRRWPSRWPEGLALLTVLSFAELSGRLPHSGGSAHYVEETFGHPLTTALYISVATVAVLAVAPAAMAAADTPLDHGRSAGCRSTADRRARQPRSPRVLGAWAGCRRITAVSLSNPKLMIPRSLPVLPVSCAAS
jgi:amino acid transporter